MNNLIFSLNVVLPLVILMFLGIFLRKIKIFDEDFIKKINRFTFTVLLPILIFNNIYTSKISEEVNVEFIIFAVVTVLITIGILILTVPKFVKEKRNTGVIIQGFYRSNFILFGMLLCSNIFGDEGLTVVTTLIAIIIPIYNFSSVVILDLFTEERQKNYKKIAVKILINPLMVGLFLGILVSLLQFRVPTAFDKAISDIAKTASPIALLALGAEIEIIHLWKNIKYLIVVASGKLFIIPGIVILIAILFGYKGVELCALFSMVTPSTAVSSYTMAQQCDCNHELAGQIVFFTTILSPLSIFLFIYILKTLELF